MLTMSIQYYFTYTDKCLNNHQYDQNKEDEMGGI
jgi:hypothetical protein